MTNQRLSKNVLTMSNLQALLICFALAGYPFVATVSTALGLSVRPLSIAARVAVLSLSIFLIVPAISRLRRLQLKYLAIFAVFWAAYLLRMAVDTAYEANQLSLAASEYWIWAVGVCLIPALALAGVSPDITLPKAFKITWFALGVSTVLAILFGSTFDRGLDGTLVDTGRLALESLNPISAGHLGASLVVFSGSYWWAEERTNSILKAASLLGMLMGGYLLLASASRGPLMAFLCVIAIVLVTLKLRALIKMLILIVLTVALLLPIISNFIDLESVALLARIVGSTSGQDLSVVSRQDSFVGAWNQFVSNPWIGGFLDEKETGFYPHNLVLEALMATGLTGGLAFLAIIIIATLKAYRLVKLKSRYAWAGLIYIQYSTGAQFSGSLYTSSIFWAFAVLMIFTITFEKSLSMKNSTSAGSKQL